MPTADANRARPIGCEYEMTVPLVGAGSGMDVRRTLAGVPSANGLPAVARGYRHDPLPPGADLAMESDSSARGEALYAGVAWFPVELKTRVLGGVDE